MLTYVNSVAFLRDEPLAVTLRNFDVPEDGFAWSLGKWCEIRFPFSNTLKRNVTTADLIFDLDVFKSAPAFNGQNVFVYLNGLRIGSHRIEGRITCINSFDPSILNPVENVLTFDTPEAAKPEDYGIMDNRVLAIQLFSLQIRPAGR
jgi:hypothetical protein